MRRGHQTSAEGSAPVQRGPRRRENPKPAAFGNESTPAVAPAHASEQRKRDTREGAKRDKAPSLLSGAFETKVDDGRFIVRPRRRMGNDAGTRKYYLRRIGALELERSSWLAHHRELAEYFLPRTQRFFWNDRNRGVKRNEKIINNTGPIALRTMSSGMHSGLTSPARPWFKLTTPDPRLTREPGVEQWLHDYEERIRIVFQRANLYSLFPQAYAMLGCYGTNVMWLDDDPYTIVRGKVFPVGSYSLGMGAAERIDTVYRNVSMSVGSMVDEFGYEACSPRVRDMYDRGNLDQWILLVQACEPNRFHDPGDIRSKAWLNVWFEREGGEHDTQFLRQSGYNSFPAICSRWNVNGEDIYGYSPAMDALGDQRALQQLERRKLATADKIVNPPMIAPSALRNQRLSLLAGDVSYTDAATPQGAKFEPAIVLPPQAMQVEEMSIREHERRINSCFFADLWLMIAQDQRATPATAEETRAKMDEKMLQLGPVVERLEGEMLDPIIDRVCDIMEARRLVPPPPPALLRAAERGEYELRVEYISILAQAVKLVGTAAIDRQVAFVANLAKAGKPEALDIINTDATAREYAHMLGTNPETLNTPEQVEAMRQARAQQEQQAQASQQALVQAQAAAHAGRAAQSLAAAPLNDPNGPSALTGLLGTLGPRAVEGAGPPNGGIGP